MMLASELRSRRQKMGLTQAALAARLGVSSNTVARWERDEPRPPNYLRLALEHLALQLEEEWRNMPPEQQHAINLERQRRARRDAREDWERLSEEQRQAVRDWFGDIPD